MSRPSVGAVPRIRRRRAGCRALGLLVAVVASFGWSPVAWPTQQESLSIGAWSSELLERLGAPATRATDVRVRFLEQWANVEGTFDQGNPHNPLDTTMRAQGAHLYNSAGVKTYPTVDAGIDATRSTLRLGFDRPIRTALADPHATMTRLGLALAESDWTGFGQGSWNEQQYASEVSGLSVPSFGLPQPTVSIRGVVVDPLRRREAGACVTAVGPGSTSRTVVTSTNGTFLITALSRAPYRLQLTDCRHVLDGAASRFLDERATPRHVTDRPSQATVLSGACTITKRCLAQSINVTTVMTYGILTPMVSWPLPSVLTFGQHVSGSELDARASVPGTFRYSVPPGTLLSPGVHHVSLTFQPRDTEDFTPVASTKTVVVDRRVAALSWPAPPAMTAGTPLSGTQLDAASPMPGKYAYSPPVGTVLSPGTHTLAVRFQPRDLVHYRAVIAKVRVTVTSDPPGS